MVKRNAVLIGVSMIISILFNTLGHAEEHNFESDSPLSLEETYKKMNYEAVDIAIKKYEEKFNLSVSIPKDMPFNNEMSFGKLEDDKLSLVFIGDTRKKVFKVFVEPDKKPLEKTNFKIENGEKILIRTNEKAQKLTWLYLQRNNQKYTLSINFFSENSRMQRLIDAANSIQ
ncbi:hypothetical protein LCM20_18270 [Halobacillus litoralis]|uniref:hypothetical protein n=1 Tax=Halobacillus litoralis TaxID=45668 RepID=UPI001CD38EB9|nr:hypothetical protein [Halobacillus litoralis]MCA0972547.1 hypothetical protein [Halobacillus litoralis]